MVAIGPEVQIGTADRRPSRIAFTMSGGAAILIVNVEGEALAKTVPFAEIGFAGRIPLGARASVGLGVKYHVVFEQEFLIMGVAPSLIVSIEP